MTGPPDTLELPNGSTFVVIESAAGTAGERVEFEVTLPRGAAGPPAHFHLHQEACWRVLEGELTLTVDGRREVLTSGQTRTIPPGSVHSFASWGPTAVRFRDCHNPALDFQQHIERLVRLRAAGKLTNRPTASTLTHGAMVLHRHRTGRVSAQPMQRAAESLLALVGRMFRYRIDAGTTGGPGSADSASERGFVRGGGK